MIGSTTRQSSLFYFAFGRQSSLIKDNLLGEISLQLDDDLLVELVRQSLASRSPRSNTTGRKTIAPDQLLRCYVLKHIKGWGFRSLETEVRNSLLYRRFTRFDEEDIPDFTAFSRQFALLGREVTDQIHLRVVDKAREQSVATGQKLRTDTTVVETNIHHPTDSSLLADGARVLTRSLKRLAAECTPGVLKIVDHARAVKRRVLEIYRGAKGFATAEPERLKERVKGRLKEGYAKLLGIVEPIVRKATNVIADLKSRKLPVAGNLLRAMAAEAHLEEFLPLVKRVIAQTKERVFEGNRHVANKVLSLFEPLTAVIKKGKAHKPTEFGRLVRLDEIENGIVSNYEVQEGNPADTNAFVPAIKQHKVIFGRAPRGATGDRGYHSASNEREAKRLGVEKVALPARGPLSESRKELQKEPWFRRLLRWRTGIESRIATLKHRFNMARAVYKGEAGFERHVGWSVITNNLVSIARALVRRKERKNAANAI